MAISKQKKKETVAEFSAILETSPSVVFVSFSKLPVKEANELRRLLGSQGVGYRVGKKTLLTRALASRSYQGEIPELPGEIAMAYLTAESSGDTMAPSREVYRFSKSHQDMVAIVGGIFDGAYQHQEAMRAIATVPPMDILRGMFVNIINAPLQRLAVVLGQVALARS